MKKIFVSLLALTLGTVAFSQTTETKSTDNNSKSTSTTVTTAPAITTTTTTTSVTATPVKRRFVKTTPAKIGVMSKPLSTEPVITDDKNKKDDTKKVEEK